MVSGSRCRSNPYPMPRSGTAASDSLTRSTASAAACESISAVSGSISPVSTITGYQVVNHPMVRPSCAPGISVSCRPCPSSPTTAGRRPSPRWARHEPTAIANAPRRTSSAPADNVRCTSSSTARVTSAGTEIGTVAAVAPVSRIGSTLRLATVGVTCAATSFQYDSCATISASVDRARRAEDHDVIEVPTASRSSVVAPVSRA